LSAPADTGGPLQWFINDRDAERRCAGLPPHVVGLITRGRYLMREHNPLYQTIAAAYTGFLEGRHMGIALHARHRIADEMEIVAITTGGPMPNSRDSVALFFEAHDAPSRSVTNPAGKSRVSTKNQLYELMAYPLLFPNAVGGWFCWHNDMTDLEGNAVPSLPSSTTGVAFTLHDYAKCSIYQRERDWGLIARLMQEWVLDQYSRIKQHDFEYQRTNRDIALRTSHLLHARDESRQLRLAAGRGRGRPPGAAPGRGRGGGHNLPQAAIVAGVYARGRGRGRGHVRGIAHAGDAPPINDEDAPAWHRAGTALGAGAPHSAVALPRRLAPGEGLRIIRRAPFQARIAAAAAGAGGDPSAPFDARGIGTGGHVLPASVAGGDAYQSALIEDGMALMEFYGKPTFWITMTGDRNWPEVTAAAAGTQHRADLLLRVFREKYRMLIAALRQGTVFGSRAVFILSVIEFQLRGIPHCHIAVRLAGAQPMTGEDMDKYVSAEVPDLSQCSNARYDLPCDPPCNICRLHRIVTRKMTHGCEEGRCYSADEKALAARQHRRPHCSKGFPFMPTEATTIDEHGYPIFRRRLLVGLDHMPLDHSLVVPHSPELCLLLNAHVCVSICATVIVIKYLRKYMCKGQDRMRICWVDDDGEEVPYTDEFLQFEYARAMSASEGMARATDIDINLTEPSCTRLDIHMPDEDSLAVHTAAVRTVGAAEAVLAAESDLTHYFQRPLGAPFDGLKYCEYYHNFMVHKGETVFDMSRINARVAAGDRRYQNRFLESGPRPQVVGQRRQVTICRIYRQHYGSGDVYYLRLLLLHRPARSFNELKTIDGFLHDTFQDAARALGLVHDENEGANVMLEMVNAYATPEELQRTFAILVLSGCNASPLFHAFLGPMARNFPGGEANPVSGAAMNDLLWALDALFTAEGRSTLAHFGLPPTSGPPRPRHAILQRAADRTPGGLLDRSLAQADFDAKYPTLSASQRQAVDFMMVAVPAYKANPLVRPPNSAIYVDGRSGRGKSRTLSTALAALRKDGFNIICLAHTALVASEFDRGTTNHKRFLLNITKDDTAVSVSNLTAESAGAQAIRDADGFLIDEVGQIDRREGDTMDYTVREICGIDAPWANKPLLTGGDLRQCTAIVRGGSRATIIAHNIRQCGWWNLLHRIELTIPFRDGGDPDHSAFVDEIGDGIRVDATDAVAANELEFGPAAAGPVRRDGPHYVTFPPGITTHTSVDSAVEWLLQMPLAAVRNPGGDLGDFFVDKAFIAPLNAEVDAINVAVQAHNPNPMLSYEAAEAPLEEHARHQFATPEFMSSVSTTDAPPHLLQIKAGDIVICLRNLSSFQGTLVNGTRLKVVAGLRHTLKLQILSGDNAGSIFFLPRISFTVTARGGLSFIRRQFPVRVCYACTIDKIQGRNLARVCLILLTAVFAHGQLYVALGRTSSRATLSVLVAEGSPAAEPGALIRTVNVVYQPLLGHGHVIPRRESAGITTSTTLGARVGTIGPTGDSYSGYRQALDERPDLTLLSPRMGGSLLRSTSRPDPVSRRLAAEGQHFLASGASSHAAALRASMRQETYSWAFCVIIKAALGIQAIFHEDVRHAVGDALFDAAIQTYSLDFIARNITIVTVPWQGAHLPSAYVDAQVQEQYLYPPSSTIPNQLFNDLCMRLQQIHDHALLE